MFRLALDEWQVQVLLNQIRYLLTASHWEQVGDTTIDEAVDMFQEAYETLMPFLLEPGLTLPCFTLDIPAGWLLCDGSIYDRVDYPQLYAALDPTFHVDADQFAVPFLERRTVYGAGGGWSVGDDVGVEGVTLDVTEIPSHNHSVSDLGHAHTEGAAAPTLIAIGVGVPAPSAIPTVSVTGSAAANITESNVGEDGEHTNISPGGVGRWIIFTGLL